MTGKKALIVKFGQIGDVIMAIPAVRSLYEQGYEIEWVCGKAALPLLASYSWMDLIPVDDRAILRGSPLQRARGMLELWSKVTRRRYAMCATLYYDRRYHLLTLPVRTDRKVALNQRNRERALLAGRHHSDEYQRLLLGLDDTCRDTSMEPVRPDRLPASPLPGKRAARRIAWFREGRAMFSASRSFAAGRWSGMCRWQSTCSTEAGKSFCSAARRMRGSGRILHI